jgi:hypothetical protein
VQFSTLHTLHNEVDSHVTEVGTLDICPLVTLGFSYMELVIWTCDEGTRHTSILIQQVTECTAFLTGEFFCYHVLPLVYAFNRRQCAGLTLKYMCIRETTFSNCIVSLYSR